jgi:hypothetical protein
VEVALTGKGASPKVWFATVKLIVGMPAATVKLAFWVLAV